MAWDAPSLADTFKLFKQRMQLVCEDNEVTDVVKIARKIKIGLGDEGLHRLNASGLSDTDQKDPDKIWNFFEARVNIAVNFRIHRLNLMLYRQRDRESLEDFVTRAHTQALLCEFTDTEMQECVLELIIAGTKLDAFRRDLLGTDKEFTLEEALKLGLQTLQDPKVDHVWRDSHLSKKQESCGNCGRVHKYRECPAYHSKCGFCGGMGHWKDFCHKAKHSKFQIENDDTKTDIMKGARPYKSRQGKRGKIHDVNDASVSEAGSDNEDGYGSAVGFYAITKS